MSLNSLTTQLTPAGKESLRKTIRRLREALLSQLKEAAGAEYRLGVALDKAKLPEARARRRARLEAWCDDQSRADWPKDKKGEVKAPSGKAQAVLRERYLDQAVKEAAHTLINRLVIVRILEATGLSKPAVLTGGWKSKGYLEFAEFATALCSDTALRNGTALGSGAALGGDAQDDTKGYAALLNLVFAELSVELPGVFGDVGLTAIFPIPAATLREVVDALNDASLDSAWQDDTTLGWVYQFWNDPEREALDDKINGGGKVEPHEIASKTQMFTERYMVEWLLQNSLGQTWLAMCKKHNWTPDFEQVRVSLEGRRAEWRQQREAGDVPPDALMPLHSALEEQWKYWVPQPLPEDAPAAAPNTLRDLKLLDPACGSGHFLVIAFDLLGALYLEEARHVGEEWRPEQIAQWIVENNLHGIDIDPRAIQIAAAGVWLKAKQFAPGARITRMNLVAPAFRLGALPKDDPALQHLQTELEREVGLPPELTQTLVTALSGVDHLGTLLRVDQSIKDALTVYDKKTRGVALQGDLFTGMPAQQLKLPVEAAKLSVLDKLGVFLNAHEGEGDLGLRLEGEQLAAGVRFVRLAQEGRYDVVVGNPPYQGTSKMAEAAWFKQHYPRSKADLYACFLERGLELAKPGGVSALLTMRGWMFLSQFTALREGLLAEHDLTTLADLGPGAFQDINAAQVVVSVALTNFWKRQVAEQSAIALQPTPPEDRASTGMTKRKCAALLAQVGRYEFDVAKLSGIEGTPLVYWWDETFLNEYIQAPKLGATAAVLTGFQTSRDPQFLRRPWEVFLGSVRGFGRGGWNFSWAPVAAGASGKKWLDPLDDIFKWGNGGLEVRVYPKSYPRNEHGYFKGGVAFSDTGAEFSARCHRYPSIIGDKGPSVVPTESQHLSDIVCGLNRAGTRTLVASLNPGQDFQVGDVKRLALGTVQDAGLVHTQLNTAFSLHESHREPSVEFRTPGLSPWRYAQDWAQRAVDRAKGEPLPPYEEQLDPPDPAAHVSYAVGVALGRFGKNGEGILDVNATTNDASTSHSNGHAARTAPSRTAPSRTAPSHTAPSRTVPSRTTPSRTTPSRTTPSRTTPDPVSGSRGVSVAPAPLPQNQTILPAGILFVAAPGNIADSLADEKGTPRDATACIAEAWSAHAVAITGGKNAELNEWLRKDFFAHHKSLYENRPIYFPLSSSGKNFVAWVSIHRWADNTLQMLLASHLNPALQTLEGEINDLNVARTTGDKKQQSAAEKQYAKNQKLLEELQDFIRDVTQCAERGAPPTDPPGSKNGCPPREVDATFRMDLDDGVMINSAALWPLLLPQWKDPKKWWKELCTADGRKDYDWAHLSARYFPDRVDTKCQTDPSLGVAHGCFWKYHPAKAYAWELRLQDEIAPDFTIDETAHWSDGTRYGDGTQYGPRGASDQHRATFLAEHADLAAELRAKEMQRRERKLKKGVGNDADGSDGSDGDGNDADGSDDAGDEEFRLVN